MLFREQVDHGELLPLKTLLEVFAAWLSRDYFLYLEDYLEIACYCGEVPLRQASNSGAPATSLKFYVNVSFQAVSNLPVLNAADELWEHTVLKTKATDFQETCHRADFVAHSSMIDRAAFTLKRVWAVAACETLFNDALRRTNKMSELKTKHDRLMAQFSSAALQCGTLWSRRLVMSLSFSESRVKRSCTIINYCKVQLRSSERKKRSSLSNETNVLQTWTAFRRSWVATWMHVSTLQKIMVTKSKLASGPYGGSE